MNLLDSNLTITMLWAALDSIVIIGGGFRFFYKMNKRLDRIEYQLYNNGGESMKDAVDRIELDLVILKTQLGEKPSKRRIKNERTDS
jgi:hypothetical protein